MSNLIFFDGNGSHENMRVLTNDALEQLNTDKVEKVSGKQLSTQDYSTAEKAKLSLVEDNATADQTGSEIKVAYEAEANTNVYTNAEKAKLASTEFANNIVVINNVSELPNQTSTTWTADAGIEYYFGTLVSTDKKFIAAEGCILSSNSPYTQIYEFTGVGTAFESVDVTWVLQNFGYNVSNGTIFDITGVGTFQLVNTLCLSCESIGTVARGAGITSFLVDNSGVFDVKTSGLVLTGTFTIFSISELILITSNPLVKLIDYTTATFENYEISNLELRGVVGTVGLVGAANSANMVSGTVGTIRDSTLGLPSTITPLGGGLDPDDVGYEYKGTPAVRESAAIGHAYVSTPALTNVLDGVDVQIAGTFTQGSESSQASTATDGTITMLNRIEKRGLVQVTFNLDKAGGSSSTYLLKVRKKPFGGAFADVDGAFDAPTMAGSSSKNLAISAPVCYKDGDEFIITIQGVGTTEDVTATTTGFTIN